MIELSQTVTICNQRGLHARASAKFVGAVAKLPASVSVKVAREDADAEGGSILGLMMLGAARGDSIEIRVSGPKEEAEPALAKLTGLVKDGFGED